MKNRKIKSLKRTLPCSQLEEASKAKATVALHFKIFISKMAAGADLKKSGGFAFHPTHGPQPGEFGQIHSRFEILDNRPMAPGIILGGGKKRGEMHKKNIITKKYIKIQSPTQQSAGAPPPHTPPQKRPPSSLLEDLRVVTDVIPPSPIPSNDSAGSQSEMAFVRPTPGLPPRTLRKKTHTPLDCWS